MIGGILVQRGVTMVFLRCTRPACRTEAPIASASDIPMGCIGDDGRRACSGACRSSLIVAVAPPLAMLMDTLDEEILERIENQRLDIQMDRNRRTLLDDADHDYGPDPGMEREINEQDLEEWDRRHKLRILRRNDYDGNPDDYDAEDYEALAWDADEHPNFGLIG